MLIKTLLHNLKYKNTILSSQTPKNMTEYNLKKLRPILQSKDEEDWLKLKFFYLSTFRSFHLCTINYPFLHTMVQFWIPTITYFALVTLEFTLYLRNLVEF